MKLNRHCDQSIFRPLAASILALGLAFTLTLPVNGQARPGSEQNSKSMAISNFSNWISNTKSDGSLEVADFALADIGSVKLKLHKVINSQSNTQFVVGKPGGGQRPFPYQSSSVAIYRGHVENHPASRVFIGISESLTLGYVDLGSSGAQYWISSNSVKTEINKASEIGGFPPNIPLCGLQTANGTPPPMQSSQLDTLPPTPRVLELAVETDYELFELFGDLKTEADYVTLMYAAMSDIFLRDANIRVELTFVRLWDTPDDLFNEESPLAPFRNYWNNNMQEVVRDAAQFFSGRRNMPYGGAAYLGSLCGGAAYSVVGYALGFSPDPSMPSAFHYDIHVTAHELSHNCGALHTHSYGIDDCDNFEGVARRGSIMSYCSQTRSGGNANTDLRFHEIIKAVMRDYFDGIIDCLYFDCNENGVPDDLDISGGDSQDLNFNGVPDECEDCNNNGQLDTIDIANAISLDLNGNQIPDECEPDCNSNNIPDDLDILSGQSLDIHGNGIPDECETDCNSDGEADYNEILADMTLDVDRNAILDNCQDCDNDGINDLIALSSAHNVWVASYDVGGEPKEFHAVSGAMATVGQAGMFDGGEDLFITPDGRILISSGNEDRVVEIDEDGQFLRNFVAIGSGGLDRPTGMTFAPNGNLIVASSNTNSVLEYHGQTGMFIGAFVESGSGGLVEPFGVAYGPDGNLYVTSAAVGNQQVLRYEGTSGDYIDAFVSSGDNGGLMQPRGILFKPNGNLLVASFDTNQILEFDGKSGAFIDQFNHNGTIVALTLDGPWGLRLGPSGNVFVSRHCILPECGQGGDGHDELNNNVQQLHLNLTRIFEFDVDSGIFLRSYVLGHDTELDSPTGFDFMPSLGNDCNFNQIPDSCDITSGFSVDKNGNGIPDECETPSSPGDLNGDGVVSTIDLLILFSNWGPCDDCNMCLGDLDGDCAISTNDLLLLFANWG